MPLHVISETRIPIYSWCAPIEKEALQQAYNVANLPVTFHHVAIMPDCHVGFGIPIGGVAACVDAVIPNAVGVDIGCGVIAGKTDFPADDVGRKDLEEIVSKIKQRIPVGFDHRGSPQHWEGWATAPVHCAPVRAELDSAKYQLGTLGGGNHFIELQRDQNGLLWVMIHSGSRNFGLKIAEYYHQKAIRNCEKQKIKLPSRELAFLELGTNDAQEYLDAMNFALRFASTNREMMMREVNNVLSTIIHAEITDIVQIHHNYCAKESHFGRDVLVHRKGATTARKGERGIIPGSMGTNSYIVVGAGNEDSFHSCSHGAGRRMGRNEANRLLTPDMCKRAMKNVYFEWPTDRKGKPDLSEAPQAYKDIDEVMASQQDLVKPLLKLSPLAVIKG